MSNKYREAGVDLEAGYESVRRIKSHVQRTKVIAHVIDMSGYTNDPYKDYVTINRELENEKIEEKIEIQEKYYNFLIEKEPEGDFILLQSIFN